MGRGLSLIPRVPLPPCLPLRLLVRPPPEQEQWEIAKLKMLTTRLKAGDDAGHGHSHAHRQPWSGHVRLTFDMAFFFFFSWGVSAVVMAVAGGGVRGGDATTKRREEKNVTK